MASKIAAPSQLLSLSGLRCEFGEGESRIVIFGDVEVSLSTGHMLAIFGPNGSGKTSLLRTIAKHFKDHESGPAGYSSDLLTRRMSLIPQDYRQSFMPGITLRENCLLVRNARYSRDEANDRLDALHKRFEVPFDLTLQASECSGGMLQQAAILRALVSDPALILADEPFAAMDVDTAARIREHFRQHLLETNASALVILHGLEDLVSVADTVFVIPDKPYSTDQKPGFHKVKILSNEARHKLVARESRTFVELATQVLGGLENAS